MRRTLVPLASDYFVTRRNIMKQKHIEQVIWRTDFKGFTPYEEN